MTTVGTRRGAGQSPGRLLLYARVAMFSVLAAFAISTLTGGGANAASGRLGGDFPAFYAAGSIVADGAWAELYDPDRQLEAQQALFEDSESSYLYFAYPPHVATLYRPLAALDYRLAYAVHSALMAAAVVAALALLRPVVPILQRHFEVAAIASLLFYPMLRAVTGGQNTGLTMLLLAATWRALYDDNDVGAGLALGLLLYKPQLALPFLGVMLLARRWRVAAAGLATGLALWAVGAVVLGTAWLGTWWGQVSDFASQDADVNGHNAVSWLGFAQGWLGSTSNLALVLAAPPMAATVIGLMALWATDSGTLNTRMAVTALGAIMVSPHAMFYDVGVLALAGVLAIDRLGRRAMLPIALVWVLAWSQISSESLGFAPLFFIIVAAGAWLVQALWRLSDGSPTQDHSRVLAFWC